MNFNSLPNLKQKQF